MFLDRVTTLNESTKKAMSAALVIAAAVAAYGWVLSPHVAYLRAVQKYEPVVGNVARRKTTVSGSLGVKRRKLETLRNELDMLRGEFFRPVDAIVFFSGVEELAGKNGCMVASIDFAFDNRSGEKSASSSFAVVTYHANLTVVGQYSSLVALFEQLQGRSQEVSIDSCQIELSDARSGRLKGRIALTVWVITSEEDGTHG